MDDVCIDIVQLTKVFANFKQKAIDGLSVQIKRGKMVGVIGADGAGKTTLLRLICGLLQADEGCIQVLGKNPLVDKEQLMPKIGYMPQKFGLYEDLTVIENLKFFAALKNVAEKFDFLPLLRFADLDKFQHRLAGKLSGGMKQKLGLICAMLGQPELIVLDEPSVGVDPVSRQELMKMVKQSVHGNTTVLWSTAYMDEAMAFDEVIVLDKGKVIFQGKPLDLGKDAVEFEEKIVELMGGAHIRPSVLARNYPIFNLDAKYGVEAIDLSKKYGRFWAVENNSFQIKKGEIFGLLGPNGAGKSTSFKMMCGLAKPTSGTAKIMGIDITKHPEKARANLGYMSQKFSLYPNLSVIENLRFFAGAYGMQGKSADIAIKRMCAIFGFRKFLNVNAQELPLGYKQRLAFACAVMHEPPVLFLDEPTSGVDVLTRKEFWNHLNALSKIGVTILITTHFMDEAEYCHRISLFYQGKAIAIGSPDELKKRANAATLNEAFINLVSRRDEGHIDMGEKHHVD